MIVPTTYQAALLVAILSMLCWGSWANTMKLTGKWRFELFYFDYSLGVLLAAVIAGFTLGSIEGGAVDAGVTAFSFMDNLSIAPKTNMGYAFLGGVIFNMANMLLVAAIAVAGLSVGFPISIGLALIIGVISNYIIRPAGNSSLLFGGTGLVLLAIIVVALAHAAHSRTKAPAAAAAATRSARNIKYVQKRAPSAMKGILLSLVSGILMGCFYPLVEMSRRTELGLGPYAAAFCFAVGVFLSTPVFNIFFMNLPVEGEAVAFREYFQGNAKQHILGIVGGVVWAIGTIANFVAASAPRDVNIGPAVSYALGQGATLISTLWGLLLWREFAGSTAGVKVRLALMLLLFAAGLGLISVAPLH